jgi:hypothetical protein
MKKDRPFIAEGRFYAIQQENFVQESNRTVLFNIVLPYITKM